MIRVLKRLKQEDDCGPEREQETTMAKERTGDCLNVPKDVDSFKDLKMQNCDVITKREKGENLRGLGAEKGKDLDTHLLVRFQVVLTANGRKSKRVFLEKSSF